MPEQLLSPQEADAFFFKSRAPVPPAQPQPAQSTNLLNVPVQPGQAPTRLAVQTGPNATTAMSPEEADNFFLGKINPGPDESLPPTQMIGNLWRAATGPSLTDEQYAKANQMEGVPLDTTTGIPASDRFQMSFYNGNEEKLKYLGDRYGRDNVRIGPTGALIIRQHDDQGKPFDTVADERPVTMRDALEFSGTAAEMLATAAGGTLAPKLVGEASRLRPLLQIGGAAAGAALERGTSDLFFTPSTKETPREVLTHMFKEGALNAGFDMGLMGLGKGALFVTSPMMGRAGKIAIDAGKGVEFLESQGLISPEESTKILTLAERTGSPLGAKVEATTSQFYRGRKAIQARSQESYDAMLAAQNAIAGVKGPDAVFGTTKDAIEALETTGGSLRSWINEEMALPVRKDVLQNADKAIQDTTQRIMNQQGSPLESYEAGEALAANAQFLKAKYQVDRNELYQAAKDAAGGAGEKTIPIGDTPERAKDWILKTVPHKQVTTEGAAGEVSQELKPMRAFATPKALSAANELASLEPGQKMSLDELITMRRKVRDAVAEQRQAIPGVDTRDLTSLADELTKTVDEGIKQVADPNAAELYRKAEAFVAKNQPVFEAKGMEKLFWKSDINPNSWLADLKQVRTTDKFNNLYDDVKNFYGKDSEAFGLVKKTLRQDLLTQSMTTSKDVLDGETLIGNLLQFARQNRKVFEEVFPNAPALRSEAEKLWASNLFRRGQTIDSDAMEKVLNGQIMPSELQNLAMASSKEQALFSGQLMRKFKNGEPLEIDPGKFVSSFLYDAKEQEVRDIMTKVGTTDPEMARDIERAAVTDLFLKTQRKPAAGRPFAYDSPWQVADPRQLTETLAENKERLKMVISPNTMDRLEQFMNVLKAEEQRDITGGMAGSFAGGHGPVTLVTSLPVPVPNRGIRVGDLVSNLIGQVNAGVWAQIITSPTIERYMGNSAFRSLPWRDQWGLIFATTPLLEELGKQYGSAEAHKIAQALNQGFTRTTQTEDMLNTEPLLQQNVRFGPISTTSGF